MIEEIYKADSSQYDNSMKYRRCGHSDDMLQKESLDY